MASVVYIVCSALSFACATLLYRGYKSNKFKLLFWSAFGFLGFALNNALLFVDLMLGPSYDLSAIRTIPALAGMVVLIYGLITDAA